MWTEQQNFAIVQTELDEVVKQQFEYDASTPEIATAETGNLFRVINTTHASYIREIAAGPGLWKKTGETQSVPNDIPAVANKQTVLVSTFTDGISLSKQLFDDNMHETWAWNVKEFAMMARVSRDANAFGLFRNYSGSTLTADGSAWGSTHTLIKGGTTNNTTTAASLSPTSLQTMIIALRQQPNQANVILGFAPKYLVVPTPLFAHACQITQSVLQPDSANNNINVYRGIYGIEVYSSPYLDAVAGGSDTAYFLLAQFHHIGRIVRQGVQTALRDWMYSDNLTYRYQGNFREEVSVSDYSGSIINAGL